VTDSFRMALRQRAINEPMLNMAVPGFDAYQVLDLLKEYGLQLEPRLIVSVFFVGDNFLDNLVVTVIGPGKLPAGNRGAYDLKLIDASEHPRALSLRELLRTSAVFNLIEYGFWQTRASRCMFNQLEIQKDPIALYTGLGEEACNRFYGSGNVFVAEILMATVLFTMLN